MGKYLRVGPGCQGKEPCDEGWNFQHSLGLFNKAYIKKNKRRSSEIFQVDEHVEIWGEWCTPSHILCPKHLFHLAVPELYLFIIDQLSSK